VEAGPAYEFDARQNELVGTLATRMRWVAYFLLVAGALVGVAGMGSLAEGGILGIIQAGFMIIIGVWTKRAAAAFDGIVQTEGSDIPNLMAALGELKKLYTMQFWVVALAIGLLVVVLLAIFGAALVDVAQQS
jgi:disulfide bond formation protein DsbB